jgi:hypothetical protein
MTPRRQRIIYTPPDPADPALDQTTAALVRALLVRHESKAAATEWGLGWERAYRGRQRAIGYGTAMGRTDGRRGVAPVYDRGTVDPVQLAYLAAYDQAVAS